MPLRRRHSLIPSTLSGDDVLTQTIQFEGATHSFPTTSRRRTSSAPCRAFRLRRLPGLLRQFQARKSTRDLLSAPDGRPRVYITPNTPSAPTARRRSCRPASAVPCATSRSAPQGVGKGLTEIVTGQFDLVAGAQNLATAGISSSVPSRAAR
jgi:hypothetical protein